MTATSTAPALFLGERPPGQLRRSPRPVLRPVAPAAETVGVMTRFAPPRDTSLVELSARLERSDTTSVAIDDAELPAALVAHLPLRLLQRRAQRHGKQVVFVSASPERRRIAQSAGLDARQPQGPPVVEPGRAERPPANRIAAGTDEGRKSRGGPVFRPPSFAATADRRRLHTSSSAAPLTGGAGQRIGGLTATGARVTAALPRGRPSRARHWDAQSARRLAIGGLAGVALLTLVAAVVPAASVSVSPVAEAWTVDVPILVDPGAKKPDVSGGRLPGRTVAHEVSERAEVPTTGRRSVPATAAVADVVFLNKSDAVIAVPKGTIVLAGATRFATQSDVAVGASRLAARAQNYGMATVRVVAVEGGPAGNVDALKINKIEGSFGSQLDVQNSAPARGGTERPTSFVTEDDRRKLHESLYKTLSERLAQQIRVQTPVSDKESVVPWSSQNPTIVEALYSKNAGEEAQTLSLSLKLRYGATVFSNEAYNALVLELAGGKAGDLKPGYRVVPSSVRAQPPDVQGIENGIVRVVAKTHGTILPHVDPGELRRRLANRPVSEARTYLGVLPGMAGYELRQWPAWFGRMPWLAARIDIVVQSAAVASA